MNIMPDQFKKFLAYPLFLGLIADSAYLSDKYYKFYYQGGLLESLGCTNDCDTVMMSPYALIFKIPVPIFGLAFYLLTLGLYIAWQRNGTELLKRSLELALLIGSTAALIFIYLMYFELHAVCKFCLAAHAMFLSLTGLYYFVQKH